MSGPKQRSVYTDCCTHKKRPWREEHDKPHQERVAATHIQLTHIFKGCMPFVALVFICMAALYLIPGIVWWLPNRIYQ